MTNLLSMPTTSSETLSILIVDDEPLICKMAKIILDSMPYRIVCAADGEEAIEMFTEDSGKVALVLTDLLMPRKDGLQLIREIRTLKPQLPIVAMTGQFREYDECLQGIPLIRKPFVPQILRDAVRESLCLSLQEEPVTILE
jgi:CheY-like chemotaxis protein